MSLLWSVVISNVDALPVFNKAGTIFSRLDFGYASVSGFVALAEICVMAVF